MAATTITTPTTPTTSTTSTIPITVAAEKPNNLKKAKVLIYGPPGSGKTTLLGTAQQDPRTSPILILDFEGGTSALAGLDVDVVKVTNWDDYAKIYAWIREGKHPYKSIAVDSISETYVFAQLNLLANRKPNMGDADILQLQEWGKARIQMQRFLRSFRDLPYHVFFTALVKKEVEPREGEVAKPAFTGSLSDEVAGMLDAVVYLAVVEHTVQQQSQPPQEPQAIRALLLHSIPKYRVKVRTPFGVQVPTVIYEPTITKLMDVLGFKKEDEK